MCTCPRHSLPCVLVLSFLAVWPIAGWAGADTSSLLAGARRVSEETLGNMRGGFESPNGLIVSFGIERVIYINGELASASSLKIADMARATTGNAPVIVNNPAAALVQNGPGNQADLTALSSSGYATVIQNSLNDQHLQAVTTIDVRVNSLQMMQNEQFGRSLVDALANARLR